MIKRNGFRNRFIRLHPFIQLQIGSRAVMVCVALLTLNWTLAIVALLVPILPITSKSLFSFFQALLTGGGTDVIWTMGDSISRGNSDAVGATPPILGSVKQWRSEERR